jgi:protein arginine kinase activator
MECDFCDSKATVFFTQIIEGITKKTNLCDSCASSQGVTDPDGFLLGDIELSPEEQVEAAATLAEDTEPQTVMDDKTCCPSCGFAFDDLKKTGRLGCSGCYDFFRSEIKHNLAGMHKGTSHSGRVPKGMVEAFQKRQQLESLEKEMAEAIDAEDYEKAASIRDQINQLEKASLTPDPSEKNPDNVGS